MFLFTSFIAFANFDRFTLLKAISTQFGFGERIVCNLCTWLFRCAVKWWKFDSIIFNHKHLASKCLNHAISITSTILYLEFDGLLLVWSIFISALFSYQISILWKGQSRKHKNAKAKAFIAHIWLGHFQGFGQNTIHAVV